MSLVLHLLNIMMVALGLPTTLAARNVSLLYRDAILCVLFTLSLSPALADQDLLQQSDSEVHSSVIQQDNGSDAVGDGVQETSILGANTEGQLPHEAKFIPWVQDESIYSKQQETTVEIKKVAKKNLTTKKLTNVVPPIPFASGAADIPDGYIAKLREILEGLRDRTNVRLHFIGHTDNQNLFGAAKRKYGDNQVLSQERAGTTAEFFTRALNLPPESISYEGLGDTKPLATNNTDEGRAQNRRVEVEVWYDEVSEEMVDRKVEVDLETKRIKICRVETVCKVRYKEGFSRRAKLKNLVPPLHYDHGVSDLPAKYIAQLKQALENLKSKRNVQMRFIGFTDNTPLSGRDGRIYRDHTGLSKAIARRVAQAVQETMGLPTKAVSSNGRGAGSPVASNNSEKGRALNRRIEVEFWHDDALESLPEEPQICPEASAAETVERIYHPPEGDPKAIYFENGQPVIPDGYAQTLQSAMQDIADKGNVRLRFIGYTSNERLDRRTAMVYGDDIGLSTARARRTMESIQKELNLSDKQAEFEGRGYVQSNDVVNAGFVELDQSKVEVQIVYDELALLDDSEGLKINRLTREVETKNPFALNQMRISVDGQPINDPNKSIPDVQRCTDVALDDAKIQFKFDSLQSKPRLNVTAWPNVIGTTFNLATKTADNRVHFKMYSNYPAYIVRAEVRLFTVDQSVRDKPIDTVYLDADGYGRWHFKLDQQRNNYLAPRTEFNYVLRVFDRQGNFDETIPQSLWVVDELEEDISDEDVQKELLIGYGENRLGLNNISLDGGSVKVNGSKVPDSHQVWFAGYSVPMSDKGEFVSELIIPKGLHTVEVAITDAEGNGNVYLRELDLKRNDWFYVGIMDLTIARDNTNGPAALVTGDETHYDNDLTIDGRLAFYTKGQFDNGWKLTASADTLEGSIDELFSNFMNKSPEDLFRRMDPDYSYPTFGDDGTVEEDAPTSGKFYLKLQKNDNYGMWGNFDIAYLDNNLAHIDRGLYGANLNYETTSTTSFGEKQFVANIFAAEPGTVAGRDEFRGTGGSLYYLKRQDILNGSDRLRIEVRDAVSGIVTGVTNLTHGLDYDIDYIQGRILLSEPLSSSAASSLFVDSADFGGNNVYLVARYEYTPGFDEIDDVITGGRMHYWVNDNVKLGLTMEEQDVSDSEASLDAYDITLRKNSGTWLKLEQSSSKGAVSSFQRSNDGGYIFDENSLDPDTNVEAKGQRLDASLRLRDVFDEVKGKFTFYNQELDAGYSAPGLLTLNDTVQRGGTLDMPVHEKVNVRLKADQKEQQDALETQVIEVDVDYAMDYNWTLGAGLRSDERIDNSSNVALTQQQGDRTDLAFQAAYDSRKNWKAYGFLQGTTEVSGNRDENDRIGVGGEYRTSDRLKLDGELSTGDLGNSINLGTDYKMSDRTNIYSGYTLENERADNGVKARKGNMSTGFKSHYSDSASVYMEEQYTHGDVPTGLTHAMGFDWAVTESWNFGANLDLGELTDNESGAVINRTATGVRVGYKFKALTYAGALEFRKDELEQPDTTFSTRTTWLTKNSIKYLLNPDWRFIGKLNYSQSESSRGEFYDGDFTEFVLGYAYRPVKHDRLNALVKYTYFYNMPTTEQVTIENTSAEYIQKSHIISLDLTYDLSRAWSVGGKYAYRKGQLSQDRVNPEFFESNASLYIARADWHFMHRWDALLEWRMLDLPDAGDRRDGSLVGLYRHVGKHIKAGIGYNFTDFSDDLTDLDYDSQGFFINLLGKF